LASPSIQHQRIIGALYRELSNYFDGKECEAVLSPYDVIFLEDETKHIVQPDISIICDKSKYTANGYCGVPELIIEVLSPSNSSWDYVKKMDLYSRFRVKEYWIVSPQNSNIQVFILNEELGVYKEPLTYSRNDVIKSNLFNKLSIELKNIFGE
jgi:Uma2 family endonuclease